ncbi:AarF/ABC1/UbiB kinase family protein [Leptolyngbya sp. FACHB-36]|uniref:ABC1 kinase family protein n=1 Tax=Leptolyngbya sp. FACHB-36 TaxID=2692808 RepID=UPI001681649A|nr:AarF/ABC1/UbiB kinase family protein [Leptolyngbya sp. FACHB-36]MBD2020611.1 AarF/ABC1/UbiB kinase family protein [Leptolyngbya sp. FACHB-36]
MLRTLPYKPPRWQRSKNSLRARQTDIVVSAAQFGFYLWLDSAVPRRSPSHRNRRAQWLVGTLLDLGPTFVKIGQALSTRADLLPLEYVQALGQLQDRVPEFSADEAITIIESELGSTLYTLYREFDPVPIAAASLGQVHKARLHTGEDVVVKVQRPGLDVLFDLDFRVLGRLVRFCQRYLPWTKQYDIEAIYHEFSQILYQEIDYIQEAINADRFRHNFRDYPRILAPKVYPKYTTRKVLTMEYLPGIKINDRKSLEACGINVKEINQLGICSYLKQLLQDGFFQADPHPGNMAVTQDGCLIFYDFGMMAEIKGVDRDQMIQTFFAILRKDTDQVLETLTTMGLIEPVSDMTPVRRVLRFVLDKFTEKPVELQEFNQVRKEVYALFEQQPFRLPAKMTFILKALTTLDGVARTLDPHYNLMACAKPFVTSLTTLKGQGSSLGELARQAREFVAYKLRQPSPIERLVLRLEERLEQGELQIRVRSLETERALRSIQLAIRSLLYACLVGFSLLSGVILLVGSYQTWAIVAFALSGLGALALLRSVIDLAIRNRLDRLTGR